MSAVNNPAASRSPTPSPRDLLVVIAIALIALLIFLLLQRTLHSPADSLPRVPFPPSSDVAVRS